ncbi:transposase [Streptomyces bambusae]|uniref:IS701 family transposase n=1 Tax=Streptomyces bambusae TaxID=1550616 RepID=UPI001CFE8D08|nr:transposase [Streptomyces bambusae]MCB5166025.1 transposase [Streptomyces bambusae]
MDTLRDRRRSDTGRTAAAVGRPHGRRPGERSEDLYDVLFASLARRDQRLKGEQYLRGLLVAEGRKSIRNIAAHLGEAAMEQSLHHFVSSSTWDWMPVRAALAAHTGRRVAPHALVVRLLSIPKTGERSVGVDRSVDPHLGHAFRGQQAFGVWQAAPALSVPVHWRLHLPESWTEDGLRRRRAEIPAELGPETLEECAVEAALEAVRFASGPRRPVVLDLPVSRVGAVLRQFAAAGVPAVVRVGAETRFTMEEPALPGHGRGPLPAHRLLSSVAGLRRPATWTDPAVVGPLPRTSLVAAVRVSLPGAAPAGAAGTAGTAGGALLLGEWTDARSGPAALWVTNTPRVRPETLLRTTRLTARVDHDLDRYGEAAGLRDFEGRSFRGWHRHITLASAAHAVRALADLAPAARPYPTAPARRTGYPSALSA